MKQDKNKFSDEDLITQYNLNPKLTALAHYFGVPDITLWRRAKRLGLSFKIGGKNIKFELVDILNGKHPQYPTIKLKKRLIKEGFLENKCNICGITTWNDKQIVLQLDHIDGNPHNHVFNNLRLLCPNCHSQTETWCGKKLVQNRDNDTS